MARDALFLRRRIRRHLLNGAVGRRLGRVVRAPRGIAAAELVRLGEEVRFVGAPGVVFAPASLVVGDRAVDVPRETDAEDQCACNDAARKTVNDNRSRGVMTASMIRFL